jgi:predicted NUDIX family phosphoesterase
MELAILPVKGSTSNLGNGARYGLDKNPGLTHSTYSKARQLFGVFYSDGAQALRIPDLTNRIDFSSMEFVYVVPRKLLFPACFPQGLVNFADTQERDDFDDLVKREGFFVEREYAERTPDLKQVIPYTVFRVDGQILVMRRLKAGGESRLHDKLSLGVGGHINPIDSEEGNADPIRFGTRREIEEEISIDGSYTLRTVGYLNDDSNPVGAVHLGVVQFAEVTGSLEIREKDMLEGRLVAPESLSELLQRGENFENWSSILIENLDELQPRQELARP